MTPSPLAQRWAAVLIESAYSPMSRRKVVAHLDEHVARLRAVSDAEAVGEWLVTARFTGPDSLRRTLEVLAGEIPVLALGGLASGYVRATRDQLFDEQEKVKNSLLKAVEDAQRDLHDSEARFAQVFASTTVGIAIFDLHGAVVEANEALATILGYEEEMPKDLFGEADAAAFVSACVRMVASDVDSDRREWELTRVNGDSVWANVALSLLRGSDGLPKFCVALIEDVSEQRMLQEWLRRQALTDLLTGLPNRSAFLDRLESALASGDLYTLCYLDVDSLTIVNDGLGYAAGDAVLVEVARRLRSALPEAVVARIGGDEFVALIHGTPDYAALAALIDDELSEPVYLEGAGVAVSTSIGFVSAGPGSDPLALLRRAHSTLRRAESGGKRQWAIFDPAVDLVDRERYARIAAMPGAFENSEITVSYTPVSWVAGGQAFVEASLRWGVSGHDECVSYADALGLAGRVGQMLLHDACSRGEPVLVRLSRDQSRDPDLASHVRATLRECAFPPSSLFLALDLRAMPDGEENLEVLADMGVRTLLHEFGGGFTGLSTVDRNAVWGVRLASPPSERLARQGLALLVPLLRSSGVHVISGPCDLDEARALGVDLVVT